MPSDDGSKLATGVGIVLVVAGVDVVLEPGVSEDPTEVETVFEEVRVGAVEAGPELEVGDVLPLVAGELVDDVADPEAEELEPLLNEDPSVLDTLARDPVDGDPLVLIPLALDEIELSTLELVELDEVELNEPSCSWMKVVPKLSLLKVPGASLK